MNPRTNWNGLESDFEMESMISDGTDASIVFGRVLFIGLGFDNKVGSH